MVESNPHPKYGRYNHTKIQPDDKQERIVVRFCQVLWGSVGAVC